MNQGFNCGSSGWNPVMFFRKCGSRWCDCPSAWLLCWWTETCSCHSVTSGIAGVRSGVPGAFRDGGRWAVWASLTQLSDHHLPRGMEKILQGNYKTENRMFECSIIDFCAVLQMETQILLQSCSTRLTCTLCACSPSVQAHKRCFQSCISWLEPAWLHEDVIT